MANLDRRWLLAALFGGTALVGWLAALVVDRGVAGMLALPDDAELADLSGAAIAPEPGLAPDEEPDDMGGPRDFPRDDGPVGSLSKEDWVDPILRRNIFDSSKVGLEQGEDEVVNEDGRRTDLKVILLATVVAIPDIYSSALIAEDSRDGRSQGYGVGDELLGEATIYRIEQKRVLIRRSDGTIEFIDMESGATDVAPSGRSTPEDEDSGVSKEGDNKFVVERSLVDQALSNPEALAKQVRVVPHKGADGEIDGYRLSGIRRGSIFEKLGIKNGDIVHSVNGKGLTSTSNALDAYNSLQNERSFSFEITRRSKRQSMEYEVR